jgi:hypothetical protein
MLVCIGSRSIVVNNLAQIGVTAGAVDNNLTLCQVGVGAISTKKICQLGGGACSAIFLAG